MDPQIGQKKSEIIESFHRNVSLLTEFVPSNEEFKRHFRKGMFDKPNTQGFIRVSHYLLSIYNKDEFERRCEWPVIDKSSEVKYRNNVKKYLEIIAQENPDIDFPNILPTCLIQASGTKFLIIMWILSIITLRSYLRTKESIDVCLLPKPGPTSPLTKTYLEGVIRSSNTKIENHLKELAEIEQLGRDAIQREREDISILKREIQQKKQNVAQLLSNLPERYKSSDYSKIIDSFGKSIRNDRVKLDEEIKIIRQAEELSGKIVKIISDDDSVKFDGNQLVRIDTQRLSELSKLSPEIQVKVLLLYNDHGELSLNNLISLFYRVFIQINQHLQDNPLENVSNLLDQLEASNKDLQSLLLLFEDLLENSKQSLIKEQQKSSSIKSIPTIVDEASTIDYDGIFQSSPIININVTDGKYDLKEYLKECVPLTPDTEKLSSLFSKHRRPRDECSTPTRPRCIQPTTVNFDDSIVTITGTKKNLLTVKKPILPPKIKAKYSRLFETSSKVNYGAGRSFMANTSMLGNSDSFNDLSIPLCGKSEDKTSIPDLERSNSGSKTVDDSPTTEKTNRLSLGDIIKKYQKLLENRKIFQELEKEEEEDNRVEE